MTKRGFKIVGILALAPLLAGFDNAPPSDHQMIDLFQTQRPVFEEIRARICEKAQQDGMESVVGRSQVIMMDPEWARPLVSDAKRDQFYALFEMIDAKGVQAIFFANNECELRIEYWAVGWVGAADYKSFVFGAPDQEHQIVDSLDDVQMGAEIEFFRRQLEGGWWLALDHWP